MEKIALIMDPGTRNMVINQKTIDRLSKIGEVVMNEGGNNIESVKPLLEGATVCVTSWGSTPLDEELLHEVGRKFKRVITVEDGVLRGGVGEAVTAFFNENGYEVRVEKLGIDDRFVEQGSPAELYAECGYDAEGILRAILKR
jgi:deoxyxylulose-5-phosphate synthase